MYDFLPEGTKDLGRYFEPFVRGLPWRTEASFSKTTNDLLVDLLNGHLGEGASWRTLEALLSVSIRPSHPWAARRIWKSLMSMSLIERDLYWTEFLRLRDRSGAIERLLSWTERDDKLELSREVAVEMVRIFSLVLKSTDVPLRDTATRALVKLGESQVDVLAEQVRASLDSNDAYVTERMLAASYGVAMSKMECSSSEDSPSPDWDGWRALMKESAGASRNVFGLPHALIRDNLEGIVEFLHRIVHRPFAPILPPGDRLASDQTVDPFEGLDYTSDGSKTRRARSRWTSRTIASGRW